ncbi:musculin [Latimeria chalumnae]|uniref:Musculin n=1 Tax=Latimeria chalumnae TaxID=7897 RepID=H3B315_LATCH|nr:PREDICTED: musculin [Latimeria chalumnae]|eukprot:XP_005992911.1 PREDICTED: musculin [Latimeria chalumnae]
MSTGSVSDTDEIREMELRVLDLEYNASAKEESQELELSQSGENSEEESLSDHSTSKRKRGRGTSKTQLSKSSKECKQSQRNAANARERARMRVLSRAFSRLKTSLPWVPPDTKLSKLDTLRLASSYIAHLRQLLQEDRYENGFVHPVNLTWPFVVSGRPESETKDVPPTSRLCGTTA